MLARLLTSLIAALPSGIKYRLSALKPLYIPLLRLGQPELSIQTSAGALRWQINELTSQEHIRATYEPYMQHALSASIRPGFVVYDIGAHAGFHTLFAALLAGPTGQVIAFEPHPRSAALIRQQALLNPLLAVRVLEYAVSVQDATINFDIRGASSQARIQESGELHVTAKRLDGLVLAEAIPPPDLIKLDVEGHEEQVLCGALQMLQAYGPIVLCDYNDDVSLPMVQRVLEPLGYTVQPGPPIWASR